MIIVIILSIMLFLSWGLNTYLLVKKIHTSTRCSLLEAIIEEGSLTGQWTKNPSYCHRDNVGLLRSRGRGSHIYSSIKSIHSIRRPSDRCNVQSGSETFEAQPLLNSYPEVKTGKDNPAFEADDVIPDYPRAKMTEITVYDTGNTEEEKIQKSCQDAPYSFTSFNETAQGSYPNDPYDKIRGRDSQSSSKTTRADSLEDG